MILKGRNKKAHFLHR